MSRFRNLEFNDNSEQQVELSSATRDEGYYLAQAQQLFEQGRFEPALRAFSRALEFNSKSPVAWAGQVRMLIELSEFSEAKVWADKGLQVLPDHAELLAAKAVALARLGDLQGAIAFSDASIEAPGNSPYIWLARGDVLLARSEKRADYCFEKALALGAGKWVWHWLAARIQSFYKHSARALKLLQDALSIEPAAAVLWLDLGRAQVALGLVPQGQRSFEQASQLDPDLDLRQLDTEASETSFVEKIARRCRSFFKP
jgi:tetratricopeptide (TPR) repeat protein